MGESVTDRVKVFEMSLISCIVFPVAAIIALGEGSTVSSLNGTIAQNITIILLPGLALAGLLRLTRGLTKKGRRGIGCLFYLIILAFCLLFTAPYILAVVEVIGHIFQSVTSKFKFEENDDDPFGKN